MNHIRTLCVLIALAVFTNCSSAALEYFYDFDDGTAMGWESLNAVSPSVCDVHWYGLKTPTVSNFALGLNNAGGNNQLKWQNTQEITPGTIYKLSFDYSAIGDGSFVTLYFFDAGWNSIGYQQVYDSIAWGWAPSLNTFSNTGTWTHKDVAINSQFNSAKFVIFQLNTLATWGLTMFDNISFKPANRKPLVNGDFETGGTTSALAADWTFTGDTQRTSSQVRSGEYAIKGYDVSGQTTSSIIAQDINDTAILPSAPVRFSAFAKSSNFNSAAETASIKITMYQNNVIKKQVSQNFVPQNDWQYVSVSTVVPSDSIADRIIVQLSYASNHDGTGAIYWDDAALTFDSSNMPFAHDPYPADQSNFVSDANLYWSNGDNGTAHDVYFGTSLSDVNNATRMTGDLNGDQQVSMSDIAVLASQWLDTNPLLLADVDSSGKITFVDFAMVAQQFGMTLDNTPYKGKQSAANFSADLLEYDTTYYWRIDEINDISGQKPAKGKIWNFKTRQKNSIATQYLTWFAGGETDCYWSNLYEEYGLPVLGQYSSSDPLVAEAHINQMLEHKVNILSYACINQAGDHGVWNGLDPDKAFQDGVMQAGNFGKIQFNISYDICSRAMMVHLCENGYQYGYPDGLDVIPGIQFNDPAVGGGANNPSLNFNLTDSSNGKYIYDELLVYDFNNFASKYFNQPNYHKINGACVVTIYGCERFNNGGVSNVADGFTRAWKRVRETIYNNYGYKLYLVGHFMTRAEAANNRQDYFRTAGFYQCYDAVGSWNVFDRLGSITTLPLYTASSQMAHDKFRPAALAATRGYRDLLSEPAKSAYGSSSVKLDFVPVLAYSFYDINNQFCSTVDDNSQVVAQAQMIKAQRDQCVMAEENSTLIYQVAWNQWGEGQILEETQTGTPIHPGHNGTMYLDVTRDILGVQN